MCTKNIFDGFHNKISAEKTNILVIQTFFPHKKTKLNPMK